MNVSKYAKMALVGLVSMGAALCLVLTGCGGNNLPGSSANVAATVNGEEILEDTITTYIQGYRTSNGLEDDAAWADFMVQNNYSAAGMRDDSIDHYVRLMVIKQLAEENNVVVEEQTVDDQIQQVREYYGYDDEQWEEQLSAVGHTVDSYREYVYDALLEEALMNTVIKEPEVTDDTVLTVANQYGTALDGSKQFSVIQFSTDDGELANQVSAQIQSGEITFDDAKAQYSPESEFDAWDCITSIDNSISEAATVMEPGAISGVVNSVNGNFIFRVDAMLTYPEGGFTEISQLPTALYEEFHNSSYQNALRSDFDLYIQDKISSADVVINEMPQGLPYDVDTSNAASEEETENADAEATEGETETVDEGAEVVEGDTGEVIDEGTVEENNESAENPTEATVDIDGQNEVENIIITE